MQTDVTSMPIACLQPSSSVAKYTAPIKFCSSEIGVKERRNVTRSCLKKDEEDF